MLPGLPAGESSIHVVACRLLRANDNPSFPPAPLVLRRLCPSLATPILKDAMRRGRVEQSIADHGQYNMCSRALQTASPPSRALLVDGLKFTQATSCSDSAFSLVDILDAVRRLGSLTITSRHKLSISAPVTTETSRASVINSNPAFCPYWSKNKS